MKLIKKLMLLLKEADFTSGGGSFDGVESKTYWDNGGAGGSVAVDVNQLMYLEDSLPNGENFKNSKPLIDGLSREEQGLLLIDHEEVSLGYEGWAVFVLRDGVMKMAYQSEGGDYGAAPGDSYEGMSPKEFQFHMEERARKAGW